MASGLALPLIPVNGRAPIEEDQQQLAKILMLQLADCENTNPFNQDVGMSGDIVFQNNTVALQALIRARVISVFRIKEKEGRARLLEGFPTFKVNSDTQELVCSIKYVDLEANEERNMDMPVGNLSGG